LTGETFIPNKEITLIAKDTEIIIDPKNLNKKYGLLMVQFLGLHFDLQKEIM
jgi:hypothetical protein